VTTLSPSRHGKPSATRLIARGGIGDERDFAVVSPDQARHKTSDLFDPSLPLRPDRIAIFRRLVRPGRDGRAGRKGQRRDGRVSRYAKRPAIGICWRNARQGSGSASVTDVMLLKDSAGPHLATKAETKTIVKKVRQLRRKMSGSSPLRTLRMPKALLHLRLSIAAVLFVLFLWDLVSPAWLAPFKKGQRHDGHRLHPVLDRAGLHQLVTWKEQA